MVLKKAFTLAEVLIVMLILSIIMAAFAPMMTTRKKVDLGSPWKYANNNSDIYYGLGKTQTAIIGDKKISSSDPKSKLIISNAIEGYPYNNYSINFKKEDYLASSLGFTEFGSIAIGRSAFGGSFGADEALMPGNSNAFPAIAIGSNTLYNADASYNNDIAIGSYSLGGNSNTTTNNIAIGHLASYFTNGSNNVAVGYGAMIGNANGSENIAIGLRALYSANDRGSDYYTSGGPNYDVYDVGNENIAIGTDSMLEANGANRNIALGTNSLKTATNVTDSVAIGYNACNNVVGTNRICIGANSGPQYTGNDTLGEMIYIGSPSVYNSREASIFVINNAGDSRTDLNSFSTNIAGDLYVKGIAYNPSDKRLKNIKSKNSFGLEQLRELVIYNYTFKSDKNKTPRIGLIAQDVQNVLPGAVDKSKDGFLSIKQENILYLMFNSIKQLDVLVQGIINELKIFEKQKAEIIQLKKQNVELEARIERLEAKIK